MAETGPGYAAVDCIELNARVVVDAQAAAPVGEPGWIALRPEQIVLTPPEPGAVIGVVSHAIYLGQAYAYEIALPGGRVVKAQAPHGPGFRVFAEGEAVTLSWRQGAPILLLK